jgi:beta-galactosidase
MRAFSLCFLVSAVSGFGCEGTTPIPEPEPVVFPESFLFGTAIAQWQNEGDEGENGPVKSNWSTWMAMGKAVGKQQNPDGNGFHRLYAQDIARAKELGLNTFRLGLDWSRIEPEPDVFDDDELDHFVRVLDEMKAQGIQPVVTLWHWTVPLWVQNPDPMAVGGPLDRIASKDPSVVDDFEDFVRHVIPRIKDKVDIYTVLNEPLSMVTVGYIQGDFPPGKLLAIDLARDFGVNMMRMHAKAFDVIKDLDDVDIDGDGKNSFVGLTMAANEIIPDIVDDTQQQFAANSLSYVYNDWFVRGLTSGEIDTNFDQVIAPNELLPEERIYPELADRLEFIGVQYYGPARVTNEGTVASIVLELAPLYGEPLFDVKRYSPADRGLPSNGFGREISAKSFRDTLNRYTQWNLPLLVTENGTTRNGRYDRDDLAETELPQVTQDDSQSAMYMVEHMWEVGKAIKDGLDIRGHFQWTLVDNHEWVEGKIQRLGAYSVDFEDPTYPRTKNKLGEALEAISKAKAVTAAIWNQYVKPKYPSDTRENASPTTSNPNPFPAP